MWTRGDEPVLSVWLGYTPDDAKQRQNRTFIVLSVRRPKIPAALDLAWPVLAWFTDRVFAEDCAIVEMEQAAHDAQGADWNQEVFPPIRKLRELLRECGVGSRQSFRAAASGGPGMTTLNSPSANPQNDPRSCR